MSSDTLQTCKEQLHKWGLLFTDQQTEELLEGSGMDEMHKEHLWHLVKETFGLYDIPLWASKRQTVIRDHLLYRKAKECGIEVEFDLALSLSHLTPKEIKLLAYCTSYAENHREKELPAHEMMLLAWKLSDKLLDMDKTAV